jgi:hypothetical protein
MALNRVAFAAQSPTLRAQARGERVALAFDGRLTRRTSGSSGKSHATGGSIKTNDAKRPPDLRNLSRAMKCAYVDRGAGRMAMWLKLAGWRPRGSGMLSGLVTSVHTQRVAHAKARRTPTPSLDDTRFLVALLNAAHVAQALLGDALLKAVDADGSEAGQQRFLEWATDWIATRAQ